ncbi:HAD hydrolase-like protein [Plantactinospora sp. CA-294935]|uniref:HAD hydrolase-like protein n=1 Tax=Plantactinospora sp. CA-294935 TaxID=3240012 RepID=UPI003D93D557
MYRSDNPSATTIVFDWSGTLVDEIDATAAAHVSAIALLGGALLTPGQWKERVGMRWIDLYKEQSVPAKKLKYAARTFEYEYRKRLDQVRPTEGAAQTLAELHGLGISMAVLSNQLRSCVVSAARRYGWTKYFCTIMAARGTEAPKADPIALWEILRRTGSEPARTIIVDDMTEGIALGRTVGLVTVGINSVLGRDLGRADFRISSLRDLTELAPLGGTRARMEHEPTATREYRRYYEQREADKSTGDIQRIPGWYHAENQAFVDWLVPIVQAQAGTGRVAIDVGSGASSHTRALISRGFDLAIRVDLSANALRRSQDLIEASGRILDVQGDAAHIPIKTGASDFTLCAEVLEHVISPTQVLRELERITRPGGWLVIAVPNSTAGTHIFFRSLQRKSYHAGHVREYRWETISPAIEAAGFAVHRVQSRWLFCYWAFFSLERGRNAGVINRALRRWPHLDRLTRRVVHRAMLIENTIAGRWARRGLGLVVIAQKRSLAQGNSE